MTKYIVVSTAVVDDIWLSDHIHIGRYLGGAGIYALSGLRLWCEDVLLVSGVGKDFELIGSNWFLRNHCSKAALLPRDAHTPVTIVQYNYDGSRVDKPLYGGEHYRNMEATPFEVMTFLDEKTRGIYVFQQIPSGYWEELLAAKKRFGFAIEWEINADIACENWKNRIKAIAVQCDILSLNEGEASAMLGTKTRADIIHELSHWGVPLIYLRLGPEGAIMIRDGKYTRIPSAPNVHVVDPTGAGNSSSAAVLYGYCENYDTLRCGIIGSISAAKCIEQYGPPEIREINSEDLNSLVEEMLKS